MTLDVSTAPPPALRELIDRYDPEVFEVGRPRARIRLVATGSVSRDVLLGDGDLRLVPADEHQRAYAVLSADPGLGVVRHADAGYDEALSFAQGTELKMPMLDPEPA